jgi:hypothetical protein
VTSFEDNASFKTSCIYAVFDVDSKYAGKRESDDGR